MTNYPKIISPRSGRYVVIDGRNEEAGRNINPFGTWNKDKAEAELKRRQEARK